MRIVLTILLLAINSVLSATNYYVKNGGNDSNSGLDDANAWAHHPWMSTWTGSLVLIPGDIVYMKRGDTWSIATPLAPYITIGQSGSTGKPITTTWYGDSGNKPLIQITGDYPYSVIQGYGKSYITFDHLDIKHFSSMRDLYNYQNGIKFGKDISNNVPHDWIITNCDIHNIPRSGIYGNDDSYNIIIGNTYTTSCATVLSYSNQIYDCGYAGIELCGRDFITNRSNWDVYYNYIHDIDFGGGIRDAYGINFDTQTVGLGQGYSTGWPHYATARFNRVEDVPGHTGVDCHGGRNIYFQDNYIYNCLHGIKSQAADRSYAETAILDSAYIERNTVENSGNSDLDHYVFIYVVAENVLYRATNCYVNDNILFYTSRPSSEISAAGIEIYNIDGITIEGNKIFNGPLGSSSGGILLYSSGKNKVKNVIIKRNWIYNWDKGINLYTNSLDGDIEFFNNLIYSHHRPFVVEGGTISNNIIVNNNTILAASTAPQPYVVDFVGSGAVTISSGASLVIRNNIFGFESPASNGIYILAPNAIIGTLSIDYNLYWNSTLANSFYFKGSYQNWTDWNKHGYDTHSLFNTDPLFINKSESYSKDLDFVLQNNSPAINKGTNLSEITHDYFDNTRDATPDIGAYEYLILDQTISVTGAGGFNTITLDKGSLQLSSSVLPSDATNKSVTWSITNGSGQATISSSGIVTAISNGTVIAKATANDGSGVYGTLIIIISNQVIPSNSPPVVVVNYSSSSYSGFVSEIDASGSYDADNDNLFYIWVVPDYIPVSSTIGSKIHFLSPIVNVPQVVEFTLNVSDGKTSQNKVIRIEILPYKPELEVAEISNIEASSFLAPYYPYNIIDGNIGTMWSADGDSQWLILELKHSFDVQHVKLAFQPGQRRESYFDILGSVDKVTWEPIFTKSASCAFSGDLQVFEFPSSKTGKEFDYIKLVGRCNSTDTWNYISELKIFGYRHRNSPAYEKLAVKIYPNPAKEHLTIRIDNSTLIPEFIQLIDLSGVVVLSEKMDQDLREFTIQVNLKNGTYIVKLGSGNLILFTQKLIIAN
jgi:hypothetical protein